MRRNRIPGSPRCSRCGPGASDASLSGDSDGPLLEFVALRDEILDRVRGQQQLFTLQLTVSAMIFGFALSRPGLTAVMLIVPFTSYLLCGRLVAQHFGTVRVAEYIMEHLSERVPGGLTWEAWLRSKPTKPHVLGSLLPHLFTFTGAGVLALVATAGHVFGAYGGGPGTRIGLITVWSLGLVATGLTTILVLQMTGRASIKSWTQAGLF